VISGRAWLVILQVVGREGRPRRG